MKWSMNCQNYAYTNSSFHPTHLQPSGIIGGPCWCFLPAHLSATKWLVDWWLMGNGPAACRGMSRWQPDLPSCFDYVSSLQSGVLGAVLLTSTTELQNKDRQHRFFTMLCIIKGVDWQLATCSLPITVFYVPCLENFLNPILDKLACCAADCTNRRGWELALVRSLTEHKLKHTHTHTHAVVLPFEAIRYSFCVSFS